MGTIQSGGARLEGPLMPLLWRTLPNTAQPFQPFPGCPRPPRKGVDTAGPAYPVRP
ncbi:hypothetical protein GCM10010331_70030 [Streptomyces xanthochromogenes]|nr:hypothetical protein GCM10010331_70030 [Streptomyces xanthochromogenes]